MMLTSLANLILRISHCFTPYSSQLTSGCHSDPHYTLILDQIWSVAKVLQVLKWKLPLHHKSSRKYDVARWYTYHQ